MSLSDPQVISLLNSYFVPVYVANEDYRDQGSAPPDERAELQRIHQEGYAKKLSVGTVHAFALGPDGHLMDSLHVANAFKPQELVPMLRRVVAKLGTTAGEPVIKPVPQSVAHAVPGTLTLHLTARYLQKQGDDYLLTGQEQHSGDWSNLPGEDWIPLDAAAQAKLLPAGKPKPGDTWAVPTDLAATLFTHFYPPTENNDLTTNHIDEQALQGTVVAAEKGICRARLDGKLRMEHWFFHKDDDRYVQATVAGYVEFDPAKRTVRSLRLVTDDATYFGHSKQDYGVAVRSEP